MTQFASITDAVASIGRFAILHGVALPAATQNHLADALSKTSGVDTIMDTLECLYAVKIDLSSEARLLVIDLIKFVSDENRGYHGINTDDRGHRIILAMRRDNGDQAPASGAWPDPESDPAPALRFKAETPAAPSDG